MIDINQNMFELFIKWYDLNVSHVRSEVVMVADRVNFFNSDDDLIGYINAYMETTHHVKEVYYNLFLLK